jgi:hypothetical protein
MSKKQQAIAAVAALAAVEAAKTYRVALSRPVRVGKAGTTILHPKSDNVLAGKAILAMSTDDQKAIRRVEEVASVKEA